MAVYRHYSTFETECKRLRKIDPQFSAVRAAGAAASALFGAENGKISAENEKISPGGACAPAGDTVGWVHPMEPPCPVSRRSAAAVPVRPRPERDQFNRASLCSVRTPCAKCAGGSAVGSQTRPRNDGKGVQVAVRAVAREQLCLAQPSRPQPATRLGRPSLPAVLPSAVRADRRRRHLCNATNFPIFNLTKLCCLSVDFPGQRAQNTACNAKSFVPERPPKAVGNPEGSR